MSKVSPARRQPARAATPEESARAEDTHDLAMRVFAHEPPSELDELRRRNTELEARLAAIEQRLDPKADYGGSGDADNPTALDGLWITSHSVNGVRFGPEGNDDAEPMPDLRHRRLRPTTWAQLCDVIVVFANEVEAQYRADDEQETATNHLQALVSNLARAVTSGASRPARDIAEALALETITRLEAHHRRDEAHDVAVMWRFVDLYNQERYDEVKRLGWELVLKQ